MSIPVLGRSLLALACAAASAAPLKLASPRAEFQVLASGRILATRLLEGRRLTLDLPGARGEAPVLDLRRAKVARNHAEVPFLGGGPLARTLVLEMREAAPEALFASIRVANPLARPLPLGEVRVLSSRLAPGRLNSFQGASVGWGDDEVLQPRPGTRPNRMGTMNADGLGGGIPVTAFWNAATCASLGCLSTSACALPVEVAGDGAVTASLTLPARTLGPRETWSSPWGYLSVHAGDFYEPLRLWSTLMGAQGWSPRVPPGSAFEAAWCSWGYGFDITPAQMLGVLPKLKDLGLAWATLDDRWFDAYGDWKPRPDTFPGDAMKDMVARYHQAGVKVQLWWLPIGAEIANGKGESHRYRQSDVVRDHPEWLVLDPSGRPATMVRSLAVLDPSLPEVRAYFRDMAVRFIRDYGFDGFKMDNIFAIPPCHNPLHHHRSPDESTRAAAGVYREILEATHALKPEAVIQICPCGTLPAADWLPWMDQGVTADPVGAVQVRRRIKILKALLGPESAVFGDHVELSAMTREGHPDWFETGEDFASTLGAGGVVGTKFVWPPTGVVPPSGPVDLTPAREAVWRKWLALYDRKRLSSGTFLNLYTLGVDAPEAYAVSKDGIPHFAFFAQGPWRGEVELRGLRPGTHRVRDYAEGRDLGSVTASPGKAPRLPVTFTDHLLLEVTP